MEKFLIVKGCAGLGNRLYTISSAIHYAQQTNRTIYIDWTDGQFDKLDSNAFNSFFELKGIKHIKNLSEISQLNKKSVFPKVWKNILDSNLYDNFESASIKKLSKIPARLNKSINKLSMRSGYFKHIDNKDKSDWKNLIASNNFLRGENYKLHHNEDIVVFVDFSPKYYERIIRENIFLKDTIKEQIRSFSNQHSLSKKGIGVHIRYTDKKPDASFDKLYIAIDKVNTDDSIIFLSTDNLSIQEMMIDKYDNVVVYPKYLPEEQNEGLHQWALYNNKENEKLTLFKESILDMWLLAECNQLIYQANSSFSKISMILKENKNCQPW